MKLIASLVGIALMLAAMMGISARHLFTFDQRAQAIYEQDVVPMQTVLTIEVNLSRARSNRLAAIYEPDHHSLSRARRFYEQARQDLARLQSVQPSDANEMTRRVATLAPLFEQRVEGDQQQAVAELSSLSAVNDQLFALASGYRAKLNADEGSARGDHRHTVLLLIGAFGVLLVMAALFAQQVVQSTLPLARRVAPQLVSEFGLGGDQDEAVEHLPSASKPSVRHPELTAGAIALKPLTVSYAPALYELFRRNAKHLAAAMPIVEEMRTLKDMERSLRHSEELQARGAEVPYVVLEGDRVAGAATLTRVSRRSQADLNFWLGQEFVGRGIATRACEQLLGYAFRRLELRKVTARLTPGNDRSIAVLERLGFRLEGVLRSADERKGKLQDVAVYGMLVAEWREGAKARARLLS